MAEPPIGSLGSSYNGGVITNDLSVTIFNGTSLSDVVKNGSGVSSTLGRANLVGYIMPAAWTAANISFQASLDGINFFNVLDEFGNEIQHIVDSLRWVMLSDASKFASIQAIKFRSGTSGTPVNQGADRIIQIIARPL